MEVEKTLKHPELPHSIQLAAKEFAIAMRQSGDMLQDDWLNHEPSSLAKLLPAGWQARIQPVFTGAALRLHTLGREDLLCTKLFALCDRGTDWADCMALKPTTDEIQKLMAWVTMQDANPDWPAHVANVLTDLERSLRNGL